MTPAAIIHNAAAEGVTLALSPAGTIKAAGNTEAVSRWLPAIRENKPGILAELRPFDVTANDPDSDREALEERAAIIAEGEGLDRVRALQEAVWQADRERTWRAFIRNARRILDAPEGARVGLLDRYHLEAAGRYGEAIARHMAETMHGWVAARAADIGGL
jgi:hypothetical protein